MRVVIACVVGTLGISNGAYAQAVGAAVERWTSVPSVPRPSVPPPRPLTHEEPRRLHETHARTVYLDDDDTVDAFPDIPIVRRKPRLIRNEPVRVSGQHIVEAAYQLAAELGDGTARYEPRVGDCTDFVATAMNRAGVSEPYMTTKEIWHSDEHPLSTYYDDGDMPALGDVVVLNAGSHWASRAGAHAGIVVEVKGDEVVVLQRGEHGVLPLPPIKIDLDEMSFFHPVQIADLIEEYGNDVNKWPTEATERRDVQQLLGSQPQDSLSGGVGEFMKPGSAVDEETTSKSIE